MNELAGHYARKDWMFCERTLTFRPRLLRSADLIKDQNYYLSSIPEQGLARALFPVGHMTKQEVRQAAIKAQLSTAEREESMGICFVGEKRKFSDFLGTRGFPCVQNMSRANCVDSRVYTAQSRTYNRSEHRKTDSRTSWIMVFDGWTKGENYWASG